MDKPEYFIEEGVRRFYNKDGVCIKKEGFNRFYRVKDEVKKEEINDCRKGKG